MKLLVIDDDDDLRETLTELLRDCGHEVATAADGALGLERLRSEPEAIEAILLDWMMQRMDGLEFRRHQRADPSIAEIPVVLMSATIPARLPLAEIQPDATLPKPIELAQLLRVLAELDQDQP